MNSFPFRKKIFWDVDVDCLDCRLKKGFVIERVLVRGGMSDVETLFKIYQLNEIIEAIKKSRNLDVITHNFCSGYFKIPKEAMNAPSEYY